MKTKDLLIVCLIPLIIFIAVFLFDLKINYFESLLLVFGVPSFYLSVKNRDKIKKVALFSLSLSIPTALIFELVVFGDNGWSVPSSILPYRLFGFSPIENYIWMFITIYIIILFYEHFCNKKYSNKISGKFKIMNYLMYSAALANLILFFTAPSLIRIPYSYLWLSIIFFAIPTILFISSYPYFIVTFLKTQVFFFYVHMIFELIAMKLNHWVYTGTHFIGWVTILNLKFPLEEFFFVIMLGAFETCTYYEFFTNDSF
ncbi:hypothetical protein HYY70_06540 [Candidatus Woesearchaeota archaeon]|nr:hypothetical protein [Candidatus Woesearchaeota archaeon]